MYCRELKLIISDMGLLLFLCFLPVVYPLVYSLIYKSGTGEGCADGGGRQRPHAALAELARKIDACDQAWVRGYASDLERGAPGDGRTRLLRHPRDSRGFRKERRQ